MTNAPKPTVVEAGAPATSQTPAAPATVEADAKAVATPAVPDGEKK